MQKKILAVTFAILCLALAAAAQGTAFTYQGRVLDNNSPTTTNYDFQFRLYDAAAGGVQQGSTQTLTSVPVTSGIFTVTLDFGDQFPGPARYLDINLKKASDDYRRAVLCPGEQSRTARAAGPARYNGCTRAAGNSRSHGSPRSCGSAGSSGNSRSSRVSGPTGIHGCAGAPRTAGACRSARGPGSSWSAGSVRYCGYCDSVRFRHGLNSGGFHVCLHRSDLDRHDYSSTAADRLRGSGAWANGSNH